MLTISPNEIPVARSSAEQVETMQDETPWMNVCDEQRHWLSADAQEVIAALWPIQATTLLTGKQRGVRRSGAAGCMNTEKSNGPGRRAVLSRDEVRDGSESRSNDDVRTHVQG